MITIFVFSVTFSSLFAIYCRYKNEKLYSFAKPAPLLLMIVFLIYFMLNKNQYTSFNLCVLVGLILGLFGDIFLLKEKLFIFGLSSFLFGHISYITAFMLNPTNFDQSIFGLAIFFSFLYSIYLSMKIMENKKYKYLLPVFIYAITISLMAASGLNFDKFFNSKIQYISIGVLLFSFSDSVWSYNKFVKNFYLAQILILTSYYSAQGLFCLAIFSGFQ